MKHMKKSMFISTVMMVVLLVVALSTATFAWFSANNQVVATQSTMTAATSSSANIVIGWDNIAWDSTISFENRANLEPMVPKLLPVKADTAYTAQYVSTKTAYAADLTFSYGGSDTVSEVNVIDYSADTSYYIDIDSATQATYPGIPESGLAALQRIFKLRNIRDSYYLMTKATLAEGSYTPIEYNSETFDYLNIVANDASEVIDRQIKAEDVSYLLYASGEDFDATSSVEAEAGYRIYNVSPVTAQYQVYDIGVTPTNSVNVDATSSATAGLGSIPYYVLTTNGTTLDAVSGGVYYINQPAVYGTFGVSSSVAGEKIYCARAEGTATKTTLKEFSEENFATSTIDTNIKFKAYNPATPVSLTELGGLSTTFYIRNDNAEGSEAATLTLTTAITGAEEETAKSDIRLAVFAGETSATASEMYYVGTMAEAAARTYYGSVVTGAGSDADNFDYYSAQELKLTDFVQIDANKSMKFTIVVWYDGIGLGNAEAGQDVNFTFNFSA